MTKAEKDRFDDKETGSGVAKLVGIGAARLQPCLKISADSIECSQPQRVPAGVRLHVTYTRGTVTPLEGCPELGGKILSGADWILIREDGVAVFDGRLTLGKDIEDVVPTTDARADRLDLRNQQDPKDFLINAITSGVAVIPGRAQVLTWWGQFGGTVPVALPIAFEGSGKVANWATPRLRQLADNFDNYRVLVERQCLAVGEFGFARGCVVKADLVVYALETDARHTQ